MKKKKDNHKEQDNEQVVDVQEQDGGQGAEQSQQSAEKTLTGDQEKLEAELAESKDKYIRLYSEFENFRRRTVKEKTVLISTANEELMSALLPVVDDFERAEKALEADEKVDESVRAGIDLVYQKLRKILEQKGLKLMDCSKGSDFDPELHEAITQIPTDDPALKGKIVDVVEKGYTLKDKVIRYAKVVVGS